MQHTAATTAVVGDGADGANQVTDASYAPRPTRITLFFRTFVPWQLVRFVAINLKMLRIIAKSHTDTNSR